MWRKQDRKGGQKVSECLAEELVDPEAPRSPCSLIREGVLRLHSREVQECLGKEECRG